MKNNLAKSIYILGWSGFCITKIIHNLDKILIRRRIILLNSDN